MTTLSKITANLHEARLFGPRFLLRHLAHLRTSKFAHVEIPRIGTTCIRVGDSDICVLRQVFVEREYDFAPIPEAEQRIQERYRGILAAGRTPVIVDAGANIGLAALWFATQFPEAKVVAIEPEPNNLALLQRNVAGHDRIIALHAAIGSEPGFVDVASQGMSYAATTSRSDAGVPILTMADALAKVDRGDLFIAKIDIEGFESDLFSQNLDWIDRTDVIVIEPHDFMLPDRHTSRALQRAMGQRNFDLFIRGENLVYLRDDARDVAARGPTGTVTRAAEEIHPNQ